MQQNPKRGKWMLTLSRVLLFCLSCAIILALSSGLTKGWLNTWVSILTIVIAAVGAFILTTVFVRWEGLRLKDVGVLPGRFTTSRLLTGFLIGSVLAALQPMLILITGHMILLPFPGINLTTIIVNLLLYLAIACREEVAFRGYPLRSLDNVIGPWYAQLIIAIVFIAEHVIGGMTWPQAILGSGMGALLFGLAALRTKGIALSIGLHSAWNFGQWSLGFKNEAGIFKVVVEKGYEARVEQIGWISYLLVMSMAIAVFYYWKKDSLVLK